MASLITTPLSQQPKVETRLVECAMEGTTAIEARLKQLDREWTRGRAAQAILGFATLVGAGVALFVHPWGLYLTVATGLLLLQNGLMKQGLMSQLLKQFGWRSVCERELERSMLKAIRGDFADLPPLVDEEDRAALARLEAEGGIANGPELRVPINHDAVRELISVVNRDGPIA